MTDSLNEYQARITSQHIDKPKFMAMVGTLTDLAIALRQAIEAIPGHFDLDSAVGAQLDIVGLVTRWVTTGCELKPVTGCPICGMAQTEQATIKPQDLP